MKQWGKRDESSLLTSIFIAMAISVAIPNDVFDFHWQKLLRYGHHKLNFETSLREGVIPYGLRINKNILKPVEVKLDTYCIHK